MACMLVKQRDALLRDRMAALDDKIWRAFGTLENARTLSSEETLYLLSHLRMGVHLGRIPNVGITTINDLFIKTQPAHLQKISGGELSTADRNVERARYLRQHLGTDVSGQAEQN